MWEAVALIFQGATIHGCVFHWSQPLWRKMQGGAFIGVCFIGARRCSEGFRYVALIGVSFIGPRRCGESCRYVAFVFI